MVAFSTFLIFENFCSHNFFISSKMKLVTVRFKLLEFAYLPRCLALINYLFVLCSNTVHFLMSWHLRGHYSLLRSMTKLLMCSCVL